MNIVHASQARATGWSCCPSGLYGNIVEAGPARKTNKKHTHTSYICIYARSEYHTQLANMSFDKIFDLTAGVYVHFL